MMTPTSEYVAPSIPEVPAPAPLADTATAEQRAAWVSQMHLFMQRAEILSLHYERWHAQQHRAAVETLTAESTAAQAARAHAEEQLAEAGKAAALAQQRAAEMLGVPAPVDPVDRALREASAAAMVALADAVRAAGPVGNTDLAQLLEVAKALRGIKDALA